MGFIIDERDIRFCLFEQLDLPSVTRFPKYADQDEDLYRMILTEAFKFGREILAPTNGPADEEGCKMVDGQVKMPSMFPALYKQFCEAGWNSIALPSRWGGQGMPSLLTTAGSETMVGANCSFCMTTGLTAAAVRMIDEFGTEEMQKLYLETMATGRWSGTMCLTEPNVGTDLASTRTVAKRAGDGTYLITGTKMFITSGDHDLTENIIHLVLARIEGMKGIKGLGLFVVPKILVNADGSLGASNDVLCTKIEEKMGIHASATCMLNFGDNGGSRGWIIGAEGDGIRMMFHMMNEARIGVGLQGVALGNAAYQLALKYTKERVQGTSVLQMKNPDAAQVAIIEHPDVRRMLMEMKAYGEGCRALVYWVAKLADVADHSEDPEEKRKHQMLIELLTPIVKGYPTDRSFEIGGTAIQAMGGVGYCREYGVEQYCRDAKISAIYEGTNGVQALDLVGRKMTTQGGAYYMTYLGDLAAFLEDSASPARLADLVADLAAARDKLAEMSMQFMMKFASDPLFPILSATPFAKAFGHVVVAHMLLWQARIATEKLEAIKAEKGAADEKALAESNDDAAFYRNKILTARFFCKNILPDVHGIHTRVMTGDESCLEAML